MTNQKEKTILITGACGFVGRHLVNYLLAANIYNKIIICCRDMVKAGELFGPNEKIKITGANLLQPSSYQDIFKHNNPRFVIHLAAMARFKQGEEHPEETIKANFLGTVKLLEVAKRFGVEKFLAASSNLARNPKGVTGISKFLTEAHLKQYVVPPETISIRLPNVTGSKGSVSRIFKQQIEKNAPVTITDSRMTRKFITPQEAAHDLLFALENGNHGDIFINNKPSTPIVNLAMEMIELSGKKIPVRYIGMRAGEKLKEADYPADTIVSTAQKHLFRLVENQHNPEIIHQMVSLLSAKVSKQTIHKILMVLNLT